MFGLLISVLCLVTGFFSKKQKTDKENTEPLNGEAGGSSAGPCPMEVEVEVEPQPKGKGKGKGKSSSKAKAGSSKDRFVLSRELWHVSGGGGDKAVQ